jgi:hypothetical protein
MIDERFRRSHRIGMVNRLLLAILVHAPVSISYRAPRYAGSTQTNYLVLDDWRLKQPPISIPPHIIGFAADGTAVADVKS